MMKRMLAAVLLVATVLLGCAETPMQSSGDMQSPIVAPSSSTSPLPTLTFYSNADISVYRQYPSQSGKNKVSIKDYLIRRYDQSGQALYERYLNGDINVFEYMNELSEHIGETSPYELYLNEEVAPVLQYDNLYFVGFLSDTEILYSYLSDETSSLVSVIYDLQSRTTTELSFHSYDYEYDADSRTIYFSYVEWATNVFYVKGYQLDNMTITDLVAINDYVTDSTNVFTIDKAGDTLYFVTHSYTDDRYLYTYDLNANESKRYGIDGSFDGAVDDYVLLQDEHSASGDPYTFRLLENVGDALTERFAFTASASPKRDEITTTLRRHSMLSSAYQDLYALSEEGVYALEYDDKLGISILNLYTWEGGKTEVYRSANILYVYTDMMESKVYLQEYSRENGTNVLFVIDSDESAMGLPTASN